MPGSLAPSRGLDEAPPVRGYSRGERESCSESRAIAVIRPMHAAEARGCPLGARIGAWTVRHSLRIRVAHGREAALASEDAARSPAQPRRRPARCSRTRTRSPPRGARTWPRQGPARTAPSEPATSAPSRCSCVPAAARRAGSSPSAANGAGGASPSRCRCAVRGRPGRRVGGAGVTWVPGRLSPAGCGRRPRRSCRPRRPRPGPRPRGCPGGPRGRPPRGASPG